MEISLWLGAYDLKRCLCTLLTTDMNLVTFSTVFKPWEKLELQDRARLANLQEVQTRSSQALGYWWLPMLSVRL